MMSSRGMGAIRPAKIKTIKKRDGNEPVTVYKNGGAVKSRVNESGNYTKPELRKKIVSQVKAATTKAKRAGKAAGKQFVAQPKTVAKKTARFR